MKKACSLDRFNIDDGGRFAAATRFRGSALKVTGGGTGTFDADLDGDGEVDGSQFGLGAIVQGYGSAKGHSECLMAGRSVILGLHLMAVEGQVTHGSVNGDGSVTFGGVASVNLGEGVIFRGVSFQVRVTDGGAGIAQSPKDFPLNGQEVRS